MTPEDRETLIAVWRELDEGAGNAPGHCHSRRGIWDDDNRPEKAGKPCEWCRTWAQFTILLRKDVFRDRS